MILILALIVFFVYFRFPKAAWLILPLGIVLDFWRLETLGSSGFKILAWFVVIFLIFGSKKWQRISKSLFF